MITLGKGNGIEHNYNIVQLQFQLIVLIIPAGLALKLVKKKIYLKAVEELEFVILLREKIILPNQIGKLMEQFKHHHLKNSSKLIKMAGKKSFMILNMLPKKATICGKFIMGMMDLVPSCLKTF